MNLSDYLVLTDMDNTLLRVPYAIPEVNIEKINEFGRLGGHIACCTGRSVDAVKHFTDVMRFSAPGITCAGAVIYDFNENKPVFQMTVTDNIFPLVSQIMKDFPEVGVEFHNCDGIFCPRVNDLVKSHCRDEFITYREVPFESLHGTIFNKVLLAAPEETVLRLIEYTDARKGTDPMYEDFDFAHSSTIYYEILPKGVSKGFAVKKLAEIMGIDGSNVISIGDFYNDIDMFKASGHTVAVADAIDDIKEFTDMTTKRPCMEGAVAELLDLVTEYCKKGIPFGDPLNKGEN